MINLHITSNHTAQFDLEVSMYTLSGESNVVSDATDGLRYTCWVGCFEDRR